MSGGEFFINAVVPGLLAVALFWIGHWGVTNADVLAPDHMDPLDRDHRIAVMRRGAIACYWVGAFLLVATVVLLLVEGS